MRKIVYVSIDYFFDVDFPVLKELQNTNEIYWLAIISDGKRFSTEDVSDYCNQNNIANRIFHPQGRRRSIYYLILAVQIIRTIKQYSPDIIYMEYIGDVYIYYLMKCFFPKKKIIIAIHDVVPHSNFMTKIHTAFHRKVCRNFLHYHTFSNEQKQSLENIYRKKSFCIPLALKDFGRAYLKPKDKTEITSFLFFGSILSYKGLDILIQACEILKKRGRNNFQLTIAGKGTYWEQCKQYIETYKLYNLLIGFVDNEDIPNLFASHHFLVLPYKDVTQSGPLMIAYNYDIPIIASNLNGFREYIDDTKNGFLYEANDVYSLSRILEKAIDLSQDEYNQMKDNLICKIQSEYSMHSIIGKYNNMFEIVSGNL